MSSSSYSGLWIHEPVHRKKKEFRIAPKTASSGNTEQQVILPDMEQFSGLPKSFIVVRNVFSSAWRGAVGIAQRFASCNVRPCGLRDLTLR